jgi:ABC-type Mn2+/Zn2+ transport system permease subunit
MRGRVARVSDRAIGILLGIVLGIAIVLLFLFLGSRNTIDEPSLSGSATQTQTQPAVPPAKVSKPKPQ